jgi:phytoene dehydrogenase-like protein
MRPANRSPVAGLHLVGGSSHPGGGLPLVTLSAEITARLLLRERSSGL